jgi:hypothetical protein
VIWNFCRFIQEKHKDKRSSNCNKLYKGDIDMEIVHWKDCEDKKVDKFPYRGEMHDVIGNSISWMLQHGDAGKGYPE